MEARLNLYKEDTHYNVYKIVVQNRNCPNFSKSRVAHDLCKLIDKKAKIEFRKVNKNQVIAICENARIANNLVLNKDLGHYSVFIPAIYCYTQGVVRDINTEFSDEEILEDICDPGDDKARICKVTRIMKNKRRTKSMIVKFEGQNVPDSVMLWGMKLKVETYQPRPKQCLKCNKFGHIGRFCKTRNICATCKHLLSDPHTCTDNCVNCSKQHSSIHDCPRYLDSMLLIKKMHKECLTYWEAFNLAYDQLVSNKEKPTSKGQLKTRYIKNAPLPRHIETNHIVLSNRFSPLTPVSDVVDDYFSDSEINIRGKLKKPKTHRRRIHSKSSVCIDEHFPIEKVPTNIVRKDSADNSKQTPSIEPDESSIVSPQVNTEVIVDIIEEAQVIVNTIEEAQVIVDTIEEEVPSDVLVKSSGDSNVSTEMILQDNNVVQSVTFVEQLFTSDSNHSNLSGSADSSIKNHSDSVPGKKPNLSSDNEEASDIEVLEFNITPRVSPSDKKIIKDRRKQQLSKMMKDLDEFSTSSSTDDHKYSKQSPQSSMDLRKRDTKINSKNNNKNSTRNRK